MSKFKTKPEIVEAVQWQDTKEAVDAMSELIGEDYTWSIDYSANPPIMKLFQTEDTILIFRIGDWFARHKYGFSRIKDSDMKEYYDKVDEEMQ